MSIFQHIRRILRFQKEQTDYIFAHMNTNSDFKVVAKRYEKKFGVKMPKWLLKLGEWNDND